MLATIQAPTKGAIELIGNKYNELNLSNKGQLFSYVPDFDYLFDEFTIMQHFNLFGKLRGFSTQDIEMQSEEYLEMFNLYSYKDRKVKLLSSSGRRKVQCAISLLSKSPVIFLDDPAINFDF